MVVLDNLVLLLLESGVTIVAIFPVLLNLQGEVCGLFFQSIDVSLVVVNFDRVFFVLLQIVFVGVGSGLSLIDVFLEVHIKLLV